MSNNNDNKNMKRQSTYIPMYHMEKLNLLAMEQGIPISRLISFAVHNEFERENPFEFDVSIPPLADIIDYAYADEAGKILTFMKTLRNGAGLDILTLLRFQIGVPDKETFLLAFADCLQRGHIEAFDPPYKRGYVPVKDYKMYRVAGSTAKEVKKAAKKAKKKEDEKVLYERLKKKYER